MARRRPKKIPEKPFAQALPHIDEMECKVAAATLEVDFTSDNFLRWMFADHVVDQCRQAFPYVRELDQSQHLNHTMVLPITPTSVSCTFQVACKRLGILVPNVKHAHNYEPRFEPVQRGLVALYGVHRQFETVRQVVRWLNEYATAGAARHYCPWLTGLLPPEHPFNQATGSIYREPNAVMNKIMPLMRECRSIVASAMLLGEREPVQDTIAVSFRGIRENYDPSDSSEYTSQLLHLI